VTAAIVDSHLHYWEPDSPERPHSPAGANLGPPVSVEDLLAATAAAGVDRVLQVTPSCMGFDNRYALEGAERYPDRIRVFGRFDPAASDIVAQLDEWHAHPLTLGVRLTLFPDRGESVMAPAWAGFWKHCAELGMPVAVYAPLQTPLLGELAAAYPRLTLLVDHCSLSRDEVTLARFDEILALEAHPNVYLKVSYFPEATSSDGYPFPRGQRLMQAVYERFGAGRLIWGSNFPPVLSACTYEEALRFMSEACDFLAPGDREAVLGSTARRVLGLESW
jgi:predicted TIM-barrel fold metal-dependent hydrolase